MEENSNSTNIRITTSYEITEEMISDLMVAAFEGGINYWCGSVKILTYPKGEENSKMYASDVISKNGTLLLFDAESSDKWILTRDKVINGIKLQCEDKNVTPTEMYDNHDADDADAIVQFALFNEIVFG